MLCLRVHLRQMRGARLGGRHACAPAPEALGLIAIVLAVHVQEAVHEDGEQNLLELHLQQDLFLSSAGTTIRKNHSGAPHDHSGAPWYIRPGCCLVPVYPMLASRMAHSDVRGGLPRGPWSPSLAHLIHIERRARYKLSQLLVPVAKQLQLTSAHPWALFWH